MSDFQKNKSPQNIALPTVGRIVHVFGPGTGLGAGPCAALVTGLYFANDEGPLFINVSVWSNSGDMLLGGLQGVPHISERGDHAVYWDWMPYQKGQAAKTEMLETSLQEAKLMASAAAPLASYDHGDPFVETPLEPKTPFDRNTRDSKD